MLYRTQLLAIIMVTSIAATQASAQVGALHYQFTGAGSSTGSGFQWSDPANWVIVDTFDGSVFDPNPATYPDDINVQFPDRVNGTINIDIDVAGVDGRNLELHFLNESAAINTAYVFNSSNGNTLSHQASNALNFADDADVTFNTDFNIGEFLNSSSVPQGRGHLNLTPIGSTLNNSAGSGIPACVGTCSGLDASFVVNGEVTSNPTYNTEVFFLYSGTARLTQDNPDLTGPNGGGTKDLRLGAGSGTTLIVESPQAMGSDLHFRPVARNARLLLASDLELLGAAGSNKQFQMLSIGELKAGIIESGVNDRTWTIRGRGTNVSGNPENVLKILPNEAGSTGDLTIDVESYDFWRLSVVAQPNTSVVFNPSDGAISWGSNSGVHVGAGNITGDADVTIDGDVDMLTGLGAPYDIYDDDTPFDVNATPDLIDIFNDYTGGTNVVSGSLTYFADNQLPDTGPISLAGGTSLNLSGFSDTIGSLEGTGTVSLGGGSLTAAEGLAPGNSPGTLTIDGEGSLTLDPAGNTVFELDALAGPNDEVLFSSIADLVLGGTLTIVDLGGLENGVYTLFDLNGGKSFGSFNSVVLPAGTQAVVRKQNKDVILVVPEPASLALLALGGLLCVRRRK